MSNDTLKKQFLKFLSKQEKFDQNDLKEQFGGSTRELLPFLQSLVHSQRIQTCKNHDGSLFWKVNTKNHAKKFQGLQSEHMLVLQEVKKSSEKGISSRVLKIRTKLPAITINKVLKILETRQLIKSIRSIAAKRQKLYFDIDTVPDAKHSGGIWYDSEGQFDEEFVNFVCKWTVAVIKQHGSLHIKELSEKIKKSNISKVSIKQSDFIRIIDKLKFENEIEEYIDLNVINRKSADIDLTTIKWKVVNKLETPRSLTMFPCGVCPVKDKCTDGGVISPSTCVYMDDWLGSSQLTF